MVDIHITQTGEGPIRLLFITEESVEELFTLLSPSIQRYSNLTISIIAPPSLEELQTLCTQQKRPYSLILYLTKFGDKVLISDLSQLGLFKTIFPGSPVDVLKNTFAEWYMQTHEFPVISVSMNKSYSENLFLLLDYLNGARQYD
jgi:hypothetical protein